MCTYTISHQQLLIWLRCLFLQNYEKRRTVNKNTDDKIQEDACERELNKGKETVRQTTESETCNIAIKSLKFKNTENNTYGNVKIASKL